MSDLNPRQLRFTRWSDRPVEFGGEVMTWERAMILKLRATRGLIARLDFAGKPVSPEVEEDLALCVVAMPMYPLVLQAAILTLAEMVWPGLTKEIGIEAVAVQRDDPAVRVWRAAVLERDGHACARCNATDHLHAHHIARWVDAPMLRCEVNNGLTLCRPCHVREHQAA